jgi:site-specific recombinase XerD
MDTDHAAGISFTARMSGLPAEIVEHLAAYWQLKLRRWRPERIVPNSLGFISQHRLLWGFFVDRCLVRTISELRREYVLQFIHARLDVGRSAKTVNSSLSALRSFLTFLQEEGVPVHPSLENIERLKEAERLPRYLPDWQVYCLQNALEAGVLKVQSRRQHEDALLLRAVFYLLWQGGLRSGEIAMLHLSDLYVSQSSLPQRLFVCDSKWRKGRVVYLTDATLEALSAYLDVRRGAAAGELLFMRKGLPLPRNFLLERLRALGRQVGVSITPHRLRHTFATQLLNAGCRVTSLQRLLGHVDLNTTMNYAKVFDQTLMQDYFQAVDRLESQTGGAWYCIVPNVPLQDC